MIYDWRLAESSDNNEAFGLSCLDARNIQSYCVSLVAGVLSVTDAAVVADCIITQWLSFVPHLGCVDPSVWRRLIINGMS